MGKVLTAVSDQMKTYKSTGSSVVINSGKATFNAQVNSQGVAVFDLTSIEDTLFNHNLVQEFSFNFNGATSVFMNSGITSAVINDNFLGGSAREAGQKVIWNFYDATDLTINAEFGGSILANKPLLVATGLSESRGQARRVLGDIIEPRIEELFSEVRRRMEESGLIDHLSAGIVLTGGAVQERCDRAGRPRCCFELAS